MSQSFPYIIVRRRVKYARMEFTPQGLKIVAPDVASFDVDEFINRHKTWLQRKMVLFKELSADDSYTLIDRPEVEFKRMVNESVALACAVYGTQARSITYRTMKNPWGSCSSTGELKFNNNLRFLPDNLIRYVAFHEVCHLLVPHHDLKFKRLLRSQFPDFKQIDKQLLGYWHRIQS